MVGLVATANTEVQNKQFTLDSTNDVARVYIDRIPWHTNEAKRNSKYWLQLHSVLYQERNLRFCTLSRHSP